MTCWHNILPWGGGNTRKCVIKPSANLLGDRWQSSYNPNTSYNQSFLPSAYHCRASSISPWNSTGPSSSSIMSSWSKYSSIVAFTSGLMASQISFAFSVAGTTGTEIRTIRKMKLLTIWRSCTPKCIKFTRTALPPNRVKHQSYRSKHWKKG